jgi:hypothetical protein
MSLRIFGRRRKLTTTDVTIDGSQQKVTHATASTGVADAVENGRDTTARRKEARRRVRRALRGRAATA